MTTTSVWSAVAGLLLFCSTAGVASAQKTAGNLAQELQQASATLREGRRIEASSMFAAIAERHQSVQALLQLARIQSGDGDSERALVTLRRARALAPNSEDVLSAFAQVALARRAFIPAIVALDALNRMSPRVAQHRYLIGVALMQAGDMPSAVDALREADRLEPDRALTLIAMGLALNNRKMYEEAAAPLRRALELEPDNIEGIAALAEAEEGLGQTDSAEQRARAVLARSPLHHTANFVLGLLLMRAEKYDEARTALLRASAADPRSPRPEYQLSLVFARLGDEPTSQQHLELYQKKLRELEVRLRELRSETGISSSNGGMSR